MAKYCGKCGAKLDEVTGLCPNCDAKQLEELSIEKVEEKEKQAFNSSQDVRVLSKRETKKQRKADKKAIKLAKKREKQAGWSTGKKIRNFFFKTCNNFYLYMYVCSGGVRYT